MEPLRIETTAACPMCGSLASRIDLIDTIPADWGGRAHTRYECSNAECPAYGR